MIKVPFLDLTPQYRTIKVAMNKALQTTMQQGDFILGQEVKEFEMEFAQFNKRKFCVGVNSGTDALYLGLLSVGVGLGDEVIVPAFTYIASALAVTHTGAKPVFVDIDERTYNIDVAKIERAITKKTKAIIPVHLYGQSADMNPIIALARKYKLKILEDTAQAHGAEYRRNGVWQIVGSMGDIGCFSFYPTKNLGAFGDGGAVVTDDEAIYQRLLMLRDYGRKSRYEHVTLGFNSRLDTVQAAILRLKLKHLNVWNAMRQTNAQVYRKKLSDLTGVHLPEEASYGKHVYHIFAIRVKGRDRVVAQLTSKGIGVLIHYPIPVHLQKVYDSLGNKRGDFPVAERIAEQIISLPMYPHLQAKHIAAVVKALKSIVKS